jgi:hypothetical protein
MAYRPGTFSTSCGFKGDKLLHALRDWALLMIENRKPIKKKIATSTHQTQVNNSKTTSSTSTTVTTPKDTKKTNVETDENKKNRVPKISKNINDFKTSKKEILNTLTKPTDVNNIENETPNTVARTILDSILNAAVDSTKPVVETNENILKPKKQKKRKLKSKKQNINEIGVSAQVTTMDKSVGLNVLNAAECTIKNNNNAIDKVQKLSKTVNVLNSKIDDSFVMLLHSMKQLKETKKDFEHLKRNKPVHGYSNDDELDWQRQRKYLLKNIHREQDELLSELQKQQRTF